jgi:hypothetical protein
MQADKENYGKFFGYNKEYINHELATPMSNKW